MIVLIVLAVIALLFLLRGNLGQPGKVPVYGPAQLPPVLPQGPQRIVTVSPVESLGVNPSQANIRQKIFNIAAREHWQEPEIAAAIGYVESSFNTLARNYEISSSRGNQPDSVGVMGLQFATAKVFCPEITTESDLLNPDINITAGIRYLKYLDNRYRAKLGVDAVIQMYNLGEPRYMQGARNGDYLNKVKRYAGIT